MLTREEEMLIKGSAITGLLADPNVVRKDPATIAKAADRFVDAVERLEDGQPKASLCPSSVNGHANGRGI